MASAHSRNTDEIIARYSGTIDYLASGCWVWRGKTSSWGYGILSMNQKKIPAHRFFYEALLGTKIQGDLVIDHLCGNRLCVNPMHLEEVTSSENVKRGLAKRVYTRAPICKYGHPRSLGANRSWCRECGARYQRESRARKKELINA